jgi:hypothetical protein
MNGIIMIAIDASKYSRLLLEQQTPGAKEINKLNLFSATNYFSLLPSWLLDFRF